MASVDWGEIDCVVLDMDGTLLDLYFDTLVWGELLPQRYGDQHGLALEASRQHIERVLGARRGTLDWYCFDYWQRVLGLEITALEAELETNIKLRPGALDFLEVIAASGKHCVLATNAHPLSLRRKLARTGIEVFFDQIVSAHEFGWAKETQPFWRALEEFTGLDPARTLFIDDNHAVLEQAALYGIRYLFGIERPDSRDATHVSTRFHCLPSFDELTAEIQVAPKRSVRANASS